MMANNTRIAFVLLLLLFLSGLQAQITDSTRIWKKMLGADLSNNDRVKYNNKIAANYWYVNADSALWFGRQGRRLLDKRVEPLVLGYNYFVIGVAFQIIGQSDSSFWYLNRALKVFSDNNLQKHKFRVVEQLADNYRITGKTDSAVALVSLSLAWFREKDNKEYIASSLVTLGNIYGEQNRNQRALACFIEAESINQQLKDTISMAVTEVGIGNMILNLGNLYQTSNPEKARNYFLRSVEYFRHSLYLNSKVGGLDGACVSKVNLISALIALKHFVSADSILMSDIGCSDIPNSRVRMSLNFCKAQLLFEKKQYGSAGKLLQRILEDTSSSVVLPILNDARLLMATLRWKEGRKQQAIELGTETFIVSKSSGFFSTGYASACFLRDCYLQLNRLDSSLHFSMLAGMFKDSLFMAAGQENIDELEIRYKSTILNQRFELLQSEKELDRHDSQIIILSTSLLTAVLLFILLLFWFRHKRLKIEKLSAETSAELSEKENQLGKTEIRQVRIEQQLQEQEISRLNFHLDLKEQDLVYHSLVKASADNAIKSALDLLAPFLIRFSRKTDRQEYNQALSKLRRGQESSPMDEFKRQFKELHPSFYENLCTACPALSQGDLLLCAMLRLNLSSKDIARISSLSFTSVIAGRSRIRKKLRLASGDNLVNILMKF